MLGLGSCPLLREFYILAQSWGTELRLLGYFHSSAIYQLCDLNSIASITSSVKWSQ